MDQGLTYQGSDTIDMQNKGTLVFHCYQILEGWYVTDQTGILKLINLSALPEVLNIATRIPFKQKLLLNVFFCKKSNNYLDYRDGYLTGDGGGEESHGSPWRGRRGYRGGARTAAPQLLRGGRQIRGAAAPAWRLTNPRRRRIRRCGAGDGVQGAEPGAAGGSGGGVQGAEAGAGGGSGGAEPGAASKSWRRGPDKVDHAWGSTEEREPRSSQRSRPEREGQPAPPPRGRRPGQEGRVEAVARAGGERQRTERKGASCRGRGRRCGRRRARRGRRRARGGSKRERRRRVGSEGRQGRLGGWEGRGGRVRRGSGPAGRYWAGGGAGGLSLPRVPHHLALGEASSSPSASFLALGELIILFSFFCFIFL
jgi:hypothetical protein